MTKARVVEERKEQEKGENVNENCMYKRKMSMMYEE